MDRRSSRRAKILSAALPILVVAAGCSDSDSGPSPAGTALAPPPPVPVEVAEAESREIIDYRVFTGRTAGVNSVQVRPRVSGYLLQTPRKNAHGPSRTTLPEGAPFNRVILHQNEVTHNGAVEPEQAEEDRPFVVEAGEGSRVEAGEPLFEIDPEPYRLAYRQALGNLQATQAQLLQLRRQRQRIEQLINENAASRAEYDLAVANEAEATGRLTTLQAAVDRAYLDWRYTQVRSPVTGIVGESLATLGNLAVADTTVLTTVVTTDSIYVYFDVDENSMLDYSARVQQGSVESVRGSRVEVDMKLANEEGYPHRGYIDFVNNVTDPSTGNTRMRAVFDNSDGRLAPGLFARVRTPFTAPYEAVLVPTIAVAADQQGRYVYVVDENMTVERRGIVPGPNQGTQTVVREGLSPGERVVVSGLQRVRPGAVVALGTPNATGDGAAATPEAVAQEETPANGGTRASAAGGRVPNGRRADARQAVGGAES